MEIGTFGQGFAYATISMTVGVVWISVAANRWRGIVIGPKVIQVDGEDVTLAKEGEKVRIIVEDYEVPWPFIVLLLIASYAWPVTLVIVILRWLFGLPAKLYRGARKRWLGR